MRRLPLRVASGALILLTAATASASAQRGQLIISPHIGMYLPIGVAVEQYDTEGQLNVRKRQLSGLMFGARARVGGEHFGVEASAGVVPFGWVAVSQDRRTVDINSAVLLGSLRGVARLNGRVGPGAFGFHASAGVGAVGRTSDAWAPGDPTSLLKLVLGTGARVALSSVPFELRMDVDDYVSRLPTDPDHPETQGRSRLQHDMVWSFGIMLPIQVLP